MYFDVKSSTTHTASTSAPHATHIHPHTQTHTLTHKAPKGRGTEENACEKRKVLKEDLKELTEDVCRTEAGSWLHVVGTRYEKEC